MGGCGCGGKGELLIFPCSGAADTGEITDKAARHLAREGFGKMYCLAGVGGGIDSMIEVVRNSGGTLVLDGCAQDCGKKVMESHGLTNYHHFRVTDLGMQKGKSPATDERVLSVARESLRVIP